MRFGINIGNFIKEHEASVLDGFCSKEEHLLKLSWLQHERLVHLIVMFGTIFLFFLFMILTAVVPEFIKMPFAIIGLLLFIMCCFYLRYYFLLENTVQYWYVLSDKFNEVEEV